MNDLSHLTDEQLIQYYKIYKKGIDSSVRFEDRKISGMDRKFLYHILRLLDEAEQILLEGDIDLQRAREPMKAIRRGDWKEEDVRNWAMEKEKVLEAAYTKCKLPAHAPVEPIRQLLIKCLEEHYGSLSSCVAKLGWAESTLKNIDGLLNEVRKNLYSA